MFTKSLAGGFVFAITLSIVVVGAAVAVYRLSPSRSQSGSSPTANSSTVTADRLTTLIPRTAQLIEQPNLTADIEVLLLRDGRLLRQNLTSSQESIIVELPTTSKVKSAAYEANQNLVAYVSADEREDTLFLLQLPSRTPHNLFTAHHPFTEGDENVVKNTYLTGQPAFVGQGKHLAVQEGVWEGCNERIFDTRLAEEIASRFCGTLNWSDDGSRLVEASTHGLVTSPYLAFSYSGRPGDLQAVDLFSAEGGRELFFDATTREMSRGFIGAHFVKQDELILVTDQGSDQRSYVLRYTPSTNALTTIARLPDQGYFRTLVVGDWLTLAGGEGVFMLDLRTKAFSQLVADDFPGEPPSDYQLRPASGNRVIVQKIFFSAPGVRDQSPVFLVDPSTKQYTRFPFSSEQFVGLRRRDGGG